MAAALSTRQAIINADLVLRTRLPAIAIIAIDFDVHERYLEATGQWSDTMVTPALIHEIAALPYVYSFDYGVWGNAYSYKIRRTFEEKPFIDAGFDPEVAIDIESLSWRFDTELELFWLRGTQNPDLMDVKAGLIELSAGRTFTQEEIDTLSHVAIVSQDFLDRNSLTLGSYLELDFSVYGRGTYGIVPSDFYSSENLLHSETISLEIVGVFEKELTSDEGPHIQRHFDILNRIYVPNAVTESLGEAQTEIYLQAFPEAADGILAAHENLKSKIDPSSVLFLLHDPIYLSYFNTAATALLPSDLFMIEDRSDSYAEIANSMRMMRELTNGLAIGALCATLAILSMLTLLIVIDRRKEIGIYLALGEKKRKIFTQISTEMLIPCILAVTLALFVGNVLSGEISQTMIEHDMIAQLEDPNREVNRGQLYGLGFQMEMTFEEMLSAYEVGLDSVTVVLFYGLTMTAILLSTFVPIFYITRLDPRKILM